VSNRDSLLDRLTGGATQAGDDPRAAQFVRGLALGALVGAAIAGSTLWGRRRSSSTPPRPVGADQSPLELPAGTGQRDITPSDR
jgi:hypothetical protein